MIPAVSSVIGAPRFEGIRLALAQIGLPAWFIAIDLLCLAKPIAFGIDARHYQRAAAAWLAGGNPWDVYEYDVQYLSGPHTLLFYAPTSLLPLPLSVMFWMLVGVAAAVWIIRRLELPLWWLAFPPLAHAIWNGNPQTLMLALLLVRNPIASAAAVGIKLYAALPLVFRWRHLVLAAVVLAITLPLFPWQLYIASGAGVSRHLADAWNGSAWRLPILLPPTVLALWVLRRKDAEWYVIPAVWPATQFYYVSTVLPAIAKRPLLAAAFALPIPLLTPLVVIVLAIREILERRRVVPSP